MKKLRLSRETIRHLTVKEIGTAAGGTGSDVCTTTDCFTNGCTMNCPSHAVACFTLNTCRAACG